MENYNMFDERERELYAAGLRALSDAGVPFMLGGAFAVWHYSHWWRNTHDVDAYVTRDNAENAACALDEIGFKDIGEQAEGDREWIYHSGKHGYIFDVIWRFANLENYVQPEWFDRASEGEFLGVNVKFVPLEELVWMKIFVINRHRCDWPDVMRVIQTQCKRLDWERLLDVLEDHWLLLAGLIDVFDWQHPGSVGCIPISVRDTLEDRRRQYRENPPSHVEREQLLDPWIHQRRDIYAARRNE